LLEQRMFTKIGLTMNDQSGKRMQTVGYVNDPFQVKVDLFEPVLSGEGPTPSLDGQTVVEFTPGNGDAVFNNLILRGGLISTKLRFSVKHPADTGIDPVITPSIDFMPAIEEGECEISEGAGFDRKITMTEECNFACLTACNDLGDSEIGPECYDASGCDSSAFATCDNGCQCDTDAIDLNSIKATDFMTTTCTEDKIELRVNKCVMNKLGLFLKDLYVDGPEATSDFTNLDTSVQNSCQGQLSFESGPEYLFSVDRSSSDCKTQKGSEGGKATYKNAIHATLDLPDANGENTRRKELHLQFGCKFDVDLTKAANLGKLGAQSFVDQAERIYAAIFEDESFTKVAPSEFVVNGPVNLGVVAKGENMAFVKPQECWYSDSNDASVAGTKFIENGCAVNGGDLNGAGSDNFSRLTFDPSTVDSKTIFGHCVVKMCNSPAVSCTASCVGDEVTVSFPIKMA